MNGLKINFKWLKNESLEIREKFVGEENVDGSGGVSVGSLTRFG